MAGIIQKYADQTSGDLAKQLTKATQDWIKGIGRSQKYGDGSTPCKEQLEKAIEIARRQIAKGLDTNGIQATRMAAERALLNSLP